MQSGISEATVHIACVIERRWVFGCWLALTVAAAAGGWFFGRGRIVGKTPPSEETNVHISRHNKTVLAADSPKGKWNARVKNATPSDFPRLLEEWETLFPGTENGIEGQPEHALRWLMAQWLVNDREGFVKAVTDKDFNWTFVAAELTARLNPELAVELLGKTSGFGSGQYFINDLANELAKTHPALFLKLDPDGTKDFTPGDMMSDNDWEFAIHALAKDDPVAAANAWRKRKLENNDNQMLEALLPVLEAWRDGDPPIKNWVDQLEDPELREIAQHARLMALARKNPHAALAELYATRLERNNDLREGAPSEVLVQLAKQDFPAALRLLKETSPLFHPRDLFSEEPSDPSDVGGDVSDPFAESPDETPPPPPAPSGPPPDPFVANASMEDSPEDNWMRSVILNEAADHLPDNPEEMIAALRQLRTQMGGDSLWQRKIEAELIRVASKRLSKESCLAITQLWNTELGGGNDDDTYQSLAARTVATDPDKAEAALASLPEAARAAFAAEIVKRLPPEESGRRLALLGQLTAAQWDKKLGESLGAHAPDYAAAIAALPGTTTSGAREAFMEEWVQNDPEAAMRWFSSLPHDEAVGPAALGLFNGWADFDKSAAVAWADTLPEGPARQAVALDVVHEIANNSPREAWRWAASITDPKVRAWAYNTISVSRDDEPEAFRKEHEAVLRAAGME